MKPNYKNWVPKGMVLGFLAGAVASVALFLVFACAPILKAGTLRTVVIVVLALLAVAMIGVAIWTFLMYRAFDYNGPRKMSKQIIDGIAEYVSIPGGGRCLDVGCGSGALAIACAKRNPSARVVGIDRWGKEYASFNKALCEQNAKAEGVRNATFQQGDATRLPFEDECFDTVVSNYVYHNIPSEDRQAILLETLRVVKKGGTFALHDIMSVSKYGDMQAFVEKLKAMGYKRVELIDTTQGKFMSPFEAKWMALSGSALLTGRK